MIDREDMLELTRRMTIKRNCFTRIAGAYFDREGMIKDTFNVNFLNLSAADKTKNLAIAKAVPFARTNDQLVEHMFPAGSMGPGSMWQLLKGIHECGLKNDLMMEVLYEQTGPFFRAAGGGEFAMAVFHGTYDIPRKAADKTRLDESEDVYDFIIGAVCPLTGPYEMGEPDFGFLFPAYSERSATINAIDIYERVPGTGRKLTEHILGKY